MNPFRVLFVCTGNICRSPSAEAVFQKLIIQAGLESQVEVDSAGTSTIFSGSAPDSRSQEAALKRGYTMHSLKSRALNQGDYDYFDLILGMTQGHINFMKSQAPPSTHSKIKFFLSKEVGLSGDELGDPYVGKDGFEHVLDLIEEGSQVWLGYIQSELDKRR